MSRGNWESKSEVGKSPSFKLELSKATLHLFRAKGFTEFWICYAVGELAMTQKEVRAKEEDEAKLLAITAYLENLANAAQEASKMLRTSNPTIPD